MSAPPPFIKAKTGAPLAFKESSATPPMFLLNVTGGVKREAGESFTSWPGKETLVLVLLASADFIFISV